jgi:hypothetical protein
LKVLLPAPLATAVFSQASCTGRFEFHFYNLLVSINVNQLSNSNFDVVSKLLVVSKILGKTYSSSNFDIVSKILVVSIIFGRQLMNYYHVLLTATSLVEGR